MAAAQPRLSKSGLSNRKAIKDISGVCSRLASGCRETATTHHILVDAVPGTLRQLSASHLPGRGTPPRQAAPLGWWISRMVCQTQMICQGNLLQPEKKQDQALRAGGGGETCRLTPSSGIQPPRPLKPSWGSDPASPWGYLPVIPKSICHQFVPGIKAPSPQSPKLEN